MTGPRRLDPYRGLEELIAVLAADGYHVVGPVVRDGVIVYDDVASERDLPDGVTVDQAPGRWRLHGHGGEGGTRRADVDVGRFSWTPAADSWKRHVFPPRREVLRIRRTDGSFVATVPDAPARPLALIGARDCELRALGVLDRVFADPDHPDPTYAARRAGTFVVTLTCGVPSATCWCTSTGGGPQPQDGFDLRVTELLDGGHRLLVEAGTDRGAAVLERLAAEPADDADLDGAAGVVAHAVATMGTRLDGASLPERLAGTDEHHHWDDVAARCLSCGNCTSVCPTCFCSSFTDATGLLDDEIVREQVWVSCFELDHSNLGGRPVRATTAARYRQWLTHKLATWPEQFGTVGCVGCGRCSTWCPAAIDLPAEAEALTRTPTPASTP